MKSRFKKGQIVEYTGSNFNISLAAEIGAKAVVISVDKKFLYLKWIKDNKWNNQRDGGYFPHYFRVVMMSPKKKFKFLHKNKFISNLDYLEALSEK